MWAAFRWIPQTFSLCRCMRVALYGFLRLLLTAGVCEQRLCRYFRLLLTAGVCQLCLSFVLRPAHCSQLCEAIVKSLETACSYHQHSGVSLIVTSSWMSSSIMRATFITGLHNLEKPSRLSLTAGTARQGDLKWKKILKDYKWCDKNGLNESFKMSPHLIGLGWHPRSLLWPASGSGLDVIWKLIPQLRHVKWGLILKL